MTYGEKQLQSVSSSHKSLKSPVSVVLGKSVPQVAIRWLLQKDIVSSVIIGVSSMTQLKHNIGAATGWKLTDEEVYIQPQYTEG